MRSTLELPCEACGQSASPEHIARRLRRLEWCTRYRPVHIQALLVCGVAPAEDAEFLYAPDGKFEGEAGAFLDALEISPEGKSVDAVLTEFQKRGLFLIHVLECPLEEKTSALEGGRYISERVPAVLARIRRSVKPKRVVLFSGELEPVLGRFSESEVGAPVFSDRGQPFALPLGGLAREELLRAISSPVAA